MAGQGHLTATHFIKEIVYSSRPQVTFINVRKGYLLFAILCPSSVSCFLEKTPHIHGVTLGWGTSGIPY